MPFSARGPGVALVTIFLSAPALAGQWSWTNNGPPVSVSSLAVSLTDGAVFAGGSDGLYKSVDHGETWTHVGPVLVTCCGALALAVDPTSGNTLYFGFADFGRGVFKSTDGGQTSVRLSAGLRAKPSATRLVIAPSDPSTIYLLGDGIHRSTDAGASWTELPFNHNVYGLAVDPSDARRIIAGTQWGDPTEVAVWLSDDGGESWRPSNLRRPILVFDIAIDPRNSRRVYAVTPSDLRDRAILRSDDGGETWVSSGEGFLGSGSMALAIDPALPDIIYATGKDSPTPGFFTPPDVAGVYRSTRGGLSWSRLEGGQRPGTDVLAIDPSGLWVYATGFGGMGVSVYGLGLERTPVLRPKPRAHVPRTITRRN